MSAFDGKSTAGRPEHGSNGGYADYFARLRKIGAAGRLYKNLFVSPILYYCARRFGPRVLEVGCGTGSGVLGAFPKHVQGFDINPHAVEFCKSRGLDAKLIGASEPYPAEDAAFDCCVLDNVLEHIEEPCHTLAECKRVTGAGGGLILVVPGLRGYASDPDHKIFYDTAKLGQLDEGFQLLRLFSIPFGITGESLSRSIRQYCLVAIYRKLPAATPV